jgi:integrase
LLIEQGSDPSYVEHFLGHKDIRTTDNVYGHLFPQHGRDMPEKMGQAMQEALDRRPNVNSR